MRAFGIPDLFKRNLEEPHIFIARSTSLVEDARILTIYNVATECDIKFKAFGWIRDKKKASVNEENADFKYFKFRSRHGRGYLNIWGYFLFSLWLFMKALRNRAAVYYACDLDTAIPLFVVSRLKKKKFIFDEFDSITARLSPSFFVRILTKLETKIQDKSDLTIKASQERLNTDKVNQKIVSNSRRQAWSCEIAPIRNRNHKVLFYGGLILADRGLELAIKTVSTLDNWELVIVGDGPQLMELKKMSNLKRTSLYGKRSYSEMLKLMGEADAVFAMYSPSFSNNLNSASGKVMEGIFQGLPTIVDSQSNFLRNRELAEMLISVDWDDSVSLIAGLDRISSQGDAHFRDAGIKVKEGFKDSLAEIQLRSILGGFKC